MLFPRLFLQSARRTPERTALVELHTDETYSYQALAEEACSMAAAFKKNGVDKGDRIAICAGNRLENVTTYLATQLIGAVAVPFNFRSPAGGVTYHVNDANADILLFDSLSEEAVSGAIETIDVTCLFAGHDGPPWAEVYDDWKQTPPIDPTVTVTGDDLSVILYSSGTTGDPKGIPITHRNATSRIMTNSLGQHYYLGETISGAMPLYHTVGLHGVLGCVLGMSGTYLTMPSFEPERYTMAIESYDVTALHEAPTIFRSMLDTDAIDSIDVSSVRTLGFSGAPMNTKTFTELQSVFDPDHFANLYGTTEVYGTLAYVDLQDIDNPGVVGKANVFIETRLVELNSNDPSAEVEQGEEGELIVNTESPASFTGYLNKPAKTTAAIHDGWFFTGDAMFEREDGNLVITGRADDVIISGGENIHPANVEDILAGHPQVNDVGVIGVPDERMGEIVFAFIDAHDQLTTDDIDQWCLDHEELADFMRPRGYEFVDELPRNPSGKVLRYKLREAKVN